MEVVIAVLIIGFVATNISLYDIFKAFSRIAGSLEKLDQLEKLDKLDQLDDIEHALGFGGDLHKQLRDIEKVIRQLH